MVLPPYCPFTTSSTEKRTFPSPDGLGITDEKSEAAVTRKIRSAWVTIACGLTADAEQGNAGIALSTINTAELTRMKVRICIRNRTKNSAHVVRVKLSKSQRAGLRLHRKYVVETR